MKKWFGLAVIVFVGTAGWRVGDILSPDALSMAIGVLFGVLAGIPAALLVMAGSRRRHEENGRTQVQRDLQGQMGNAAYGWGMPQQPQAPIIVLAGAPAGLQGMQTMQANAQWLPQETSTRHFTVVGEREELLEEW